MSVMLRHEARSWALGRGASFCRHEVVVGASGKLAEEISDVELDKRGIYGISTVI